MSEERSETLTVRREPEGDHAATESDYDAAESDPPIERGASLGRYVILDTLGEGGMGVVYSAYDPELDRRIAIKLLRNASSREGNARLLREARAMARLNHRNVATVHDVGTVDGSVFIAIEYLEGETLKEHLAAHTDSSRLDYREILRLFLTAAEGLAAAHEAGFIHRDFKPENVMLTADGRVVVLDFGLAAPPAEGTASGDSHSDTPFDGSSLTVTGTIMGTPAYMSPEQMAGKPVGPASDQFSFCVALFEGLHGERPFSGDNFADLYDNVSSGGPPTRPDTRDVPVWVQRAVDRGLQLNADDRFATMRELIAALRDDPSARRRRVLVPAVAVVGIGTLAAVGFLASPDAVDPCANATQDLAEIYGDAQREAIRALSTDAGPRLVDRLDDYAQQWAEARLVSCQANRIRQEETDELYDRRLVCLDERLNALESFVTRLVDSDEGDVPRALMLSSRLPAIGLCQIDAFVLADVRPPSDPELAAEVRDIRRQLTLTTRRSHLVGSVAAQEASVPLLERARASGYGPVVAEVLFAEAGTAEAKEADNARELTVEALLVAERHRHDRLVVKGLQALARIDGRAEKRDRAAEHLQRAAAVLGRMGNPEVLVLALLRARAEQAMRDYDIVAARGFLEEALAIRRANGTIDGIWSILDAAMLAEACLAQQDFECGRRNAEHALSTARTELGPLNPILAELNAVAGNASLATGDPEAALERYAEAAKRMAASNEGPFNRAALKNQTAQAHTMAGNLEAAEKEFVTGLELAASYFEPDHPNYLVLRTNFLEFLVERGRLDEACPQLADVRERVLVALDRQWASGRASHGLYGDCRYAAGDREGARAAYESATVLNDGEQGDQGYVMGLEGLARLELDGGNLEKAEALARRGTEVDLGVDGYGSGSSIMFALAEIVHAAGRPSEALELARNAQRAYDSTGCCPEALARVRAWIADHEAG